MRIDLVINRQARRFQREPQLLARLRAAARGCAVHVTDDTHDLDDVAAELARRGTELVLLAGGDGSLMAGVTALHAAFAGAPPPLSPIPAGTAATIARNWDIAGDPLACLERALSRPRRMVARPSLRVSETNGAAAPRERIGFIMGTGLVAKFFRVYYEHGAPGYAGSARLVARIFVESFYGGPLAARVLDPLPCNLVVEGEPLAPRAWSLVCCAVVRNLGIHMLVNHRAAEDPRRPHLVATPMLPRQLGPRAPWVLAGKPFGGPGHVDRLVRDFAVDFAGHGAEQEHSGSRVPTASLSPVARAGPYVLDGELLAATRVTVSAGPVITVATPT